MLKYALLLPTVLLFAACGGGGDDDDPASNASPTVFSEATDEGAATSGETEISAIPAGGHWIVGDNNFVVGIIDANGTPQGGATVEITFFDNVNTASQKERFVEAAIQSAPGVGPETVHVHAGGVEHVHGGEAADRVGYYTGVTFDHAGTWGAAVKATLKDGSTGTSNIAFEVKADAPVPVPGEPAIASDNLTKNDVANISEIDSGSPPNDMHDVKIKDAIAAGRPLVVIFSTPAYCTSLFCGPVNEEVELLHDKYAETVDFVHIEIWRDFATKQFNPTAREWIVEPDGTVLEPVVYIIDKTGTIYDRFEGPVAGNILEPAVQAISEGQTFQ